MKKVIVLFAVVFSINFTANKVFAQTAPASTVLSGIGDESLYYKFAALVRSANLDATLNALGSYTVLAPPNVLFRNMSPGKLDSLQNDPVKLAMVLKAHIIKGKYSKATIIKMMNANKAKLTLTNLLGQPLKLSLSKDSKLIVTDSNGIQAYFTAFDMPDPKAVIHGIDNVLVIGK